MKPLFYFLLFFMFSGVLLAQPGVPPLIPEAEPRRVAIEYFYDNGKLIRLDSKYKAYIAFIDSINGTIRVAKPSIHFDEGLTCGKNETVQLILKYKRDVIITPFCFFFFNYLEKQTINLGYSKIYDIRKPTRRHRFFPPLDTSKTGTPYYYIEKHSHPVYPVARVGLFVEYINTFNLYNDIIKLDKEEIQRINPKKCRMVYFEQRIGLPSDDSDEEQGLTHGVTRTNLGQYYLITDIKQYKKASRAYFKAIEKIYHNENEN